jgi:molecular chaperone DnaK (HSP70)
MKRSELEQLAMPVLGELAGSLLGIRQRVEPLAQIHSVELIGGLSRMPFIQEMVKTVFGMEPSKKMNASESVARGAAIAAASRRGLLKTNSYNFIKTVRCPIVNYIHCTATDKVLYGRDLAPYLLCQKKLIFSRKNTMPTHKVVKIEGNGQMEVLVCSEEMLGSVRVGYLCFTGPDALTMLMDSDGILRARLSKQKKFEVEDLGDWLTPPKLLKLKEF